MNHPPIPLPSSIRSRSIEGINGLKVHVLEAGFETRDRPCVLLLHGFPGTRLQLAQGHAGTGGGRLSRDRAGPARLWPHHRDGTRISTATCAVSLAESGARRAWRRSAFGHRSVAAVVGHDFGSSVAAWCGVIRPDVFRSVVLMSAPFAGPPQIAVNTADTPLPPKREDPVHHELATLPRPRKHYHWYYSTREANADMWHAPQGVHDFLRAYYHHKSADWKDNRPYPLKSWSAGELARLPTYYVMDLARTMPATVAEEMPSRDANRRQCMASRRRTCRLQRRIPPDRIPGRPAMVSLRHVGSLHRRARNLVRQEHRRALLLHLGQTGLGHLSAPRRVRDDAEEAPARACSTFI